MIALTSKENISIFIIWLFIACAVIGIQMGYEDWFLSLSPLNLILFLGLIIWNTPYPMNLVIVMFIPFIIGILVEYLGVNFGLIFGEYEYGENLGFKIAGVPLMIGVNWVILTYCSASIARRVTSRAWIVAGIASLLMVLLDLIIEIAAPAMDYWEFEGGQVPLQNYIGWFGTSFIAHLLFQKWNKYHNLKISIHILSAMLMFFIAFIYLKL
ncbi:carotenoid biosynthesis protein [Aquimarina sp. ERC-38]|uniref:carotenoid biosynthesis protein n=1 Tax=Aquimarina sp. ERC-38 TaxID=2949996 RepID=UPI0022474C55|nr:carotenoid biosynthesis protein [Aquimarina sp. ERC-38]UZO81904.1 carotenoid biosynthesis protein [Aquimarina sp. ERC-38]